mmetsp:Transcript_13725/g.20208  ORF Transcript_13725/g.20208 Transcript_13725/m.20208 type:complete len:101 (+) Transcript_13725:76-378(+)
MGKKGKKKGKDPAQLEHERQEELEEQKKKEMQIKARDLRERCEREEKDFHHFLMEREKINYFWIVEKKTLTEKQADLRNSYFCCMSLAFRSNSCRSSRIF